MKSLFTLLSYILWIGLIILAVMNLSDVSHINLISSDISTLLSDKLNLHLPVTSIYLKSPVLYFILFALGECAGIAFIMPLCRSMQDKVAAYKRELEKGSVTNSTSSSKIEVLENKIQVLEKALDDALKNQK